MKTMVDVQKLLRNFGIFIYTGDRQGDLEWMEQELSDLYSAQLIDVKTLQIARLIIKQEIRLLSGE